MLIQNVNSLLDVFNAKSIEDLENIIYHMSTCGAYFKLNDNQSSFVIGTIMSGSCKEWEETFNFPVTKEEILNWINSMDIMVDSVNLVN